MKDVTDIANQITNRGSSLPSNESTQTSSRSSDRDKIMMMWTSIGSMYTHLWTSAHGDTVDAGRIWEACLKGISFQQIKQGLEVLANSGREFPPSAPLFKTMCDGTFETKDQPTGSDATAQKMFEPETLLQNTTHAERQAKGRVEVLAIKKMLAKK